MHVQYMSLDYMTLAMHTLTIPYYVTSLKMYRCDSGDQTTELSAKSVKICVWWTGSLLSQRY